MNGRLSRKNYAVFYGPTTGDRIRLGDTDLFIEIEQDLHRYGEELTLKAGGAARAGMAQSDKTAEQGAVDLVLVNVVVIDHHRIIKADIGVKEGRISHIGRAGNPAIQDGIDIIIGPETEVIAGEGMIVTAGAVDSNVHFIGPQQVEEALMSGVTTLLGGGTGPATGSVVTGSTPGVQGLHDMLAAAEGFPVNLGFFGKGNATFPAALEDQIRNGAMGLSLHDIGGATPEAINAALSVAETYGVQVRLHTDSLNEAGHVEDTINALVGRSVQACVNGGHLPDVLKLAGESNVLPMTTNFNQLNTHNAAAELSSLVIARNRLKLREPNDIELAKLLVRPVSFGAQEILHDMGAISMVGSASIHIGETIQRVWQLAHKMKKQRGHIGGVEEKSDNFRVKRYIAKYTINPAIAYGLDRRLGSIDVGKVADLVLWQPALFGVKPSLVLKSGCVAAALQGDSSASLTDMQPVMYRKMFYAYGKAAQRSLLFVSQLAYDDDIKGRLEIQRDVVAINSARPVKSAMIHNNVTPNITVDPETQIVSADREALINQPYSFLPLAQRYFIF
ncbi:urease subunit alpha [Serratia marcescens]|nr:urease subunit alpha [Serratia marcescens]